MSNVINEKENLLHIAFDRLSEKYPSGLYEWMYVNDPDACRELSELEDRINDNVRTNGSIQDLKALLRTYWVAHMNAIKAFNECDKTDSILDEAKAERIRELETSHTT